MELRKRRELKEARMQWRASEMRERGWRERRKEASRMEAMGDRREERIKEGRVTKDVRRKVRE